MKYTGNLLLLKTYRDNYIIKRFLGYSKGVNGLPKMVPEEAEIVHRIYRLFMEGTSTNAIALYYTSEGIATPNGKKILQRAVTESILTNEKYKGAALLQNTLYGRFFAEENER